MGVLLAALAGARTVQLTRHPFVVGRNHAANPPGPVDANNSPSLAQNPMRPSNVVLTHRVDRPAFSAALEWSGDGGASWHHTALPLPPGLDRPFAPDATFAPDGTLYVTYVNLVGVGNVPGTLWVARSSDGGRSLSEPVRVAGDLAFQARVAAGPNGVVHVTWLQASDVGLFRLVGSPNPVVAATSDDGGHTFSAPVRVSDPGRERVGAATPLVDGSGRLTVLYEDFGDDRRDFEFLEGPPADQPFALVITSSTDGGRSFAPGTEVDTGVVATHRFWVFLPEFPSIAIGPGGELYVAWADGRNGDDDVFVRRSDDNGVHWSAPTRVNDNPQGDRTSQYLPRVAVAPSGRVDVVFLDRRRDPKRNVMTDAYLGVSADQGRSFRDLRVSSRAFDSRVGPLPDERFPVDFGSRLGLLSGPRDALAAWTDSRHGTVDTGRQDVFTAKVARREGSVVEWAGVAVTALLALAALAGAALGLVTARRRR